jgi:coenzyme F420 hydrogenase subunit beta
VAVCPPKNVKLKLGCVDPELMGECMEGCNLCNNVCPGAYIPKSELEAMIFGRKRTEEEELFGQYKDHLVTHAKNEKVHYAGVAGGTVTALLLYALEEGIIDGAIVAGYDENEPWKVKAKIATTKEDLLNCVRSKYAICNTVSVLRDAVNQGLQKIAIVALPCHTYALRMMQLRKGWLADKVELIIGLYCLSQTYMEGTEYIIRERLGIPLDQVDQISYRGRLGDPFGGGFWVKTKTGEEKSLQLIAHWGMVPTIFIGFQVERCLLCLDHTCELADLSAGDVWGREEELKKINEYGWTGVFVRTDKGEEIFRGAVEAGYIVSEPGGSIESYYPVNPGHPKKKFAVPTRIEYRKKYGWPVPKIT